MMIKKQICTFVVLLFVITGSVIGSGDKKQQLSDIYSMFSSYTDRVTGQVKTIQLEDTPLNKASDNLERDFPEIFSQLPGLKEDKEHEEDEEIIFVNIASAKEQLPRTATSKILSIFGLGNDQDEHVTIIPAPQVPLSNPDEKSLIAEIEDFESEILCADGFVDKSNNSLVDPFLKASSDLNITSQGDMSSFSFARPQMRMIFIPSKNKYRGADSSSVSTFKSLHGGNIKR